MVRELVFLVFRDKIRIELGEKAQNILIDKKRLQRKN